MKKIFSLLVALCLVLSIFAAGAVYADEPEKPVVYFTDDISPEGLVAVYEALNWKPVGPVAVKLSTGEPPYSNYLRPELIADLVHLVDGTIVECNTAYAGYRAATAEHYQVAEDHGYTLDDIIFIGDDFADGGGDSHVRIKGMDHIVITDYRRFADAVSVLLK